MEFIEKYAHAYKNIFDSEMDILDKEQQAQLLAQAMMNEVVQKAIELKEAEVKQQLQSDGYVAQKKETRTVQCVYGPMTITRTPFKKKGRKKVYKPVDEWLEWGAGHRNSPGFVAKILQIAPAVNSYAKTSLVIETMTTCVVSRTSIMRMVKLYGNRYNEYLNHLEDFPEHIEKKDKKKVKQLYIEGDGVCFKLQNGQLKFVHVFMLHEGVKTISRDRKQSQNKFYFVNESRKKAVNQIKSYISTYYNVEDTLILANSDGGSGYEEGVFRDIAGVCGSFEYFIDRYHVSRKLEERISIEAFIPVFQQAINLGSLNQLKMAFDTYEGYLETEEQLSDMKKLKNYLSRHWKHLESLASRGYDIVKEGIGIMESQLRHFTYRLKHCGRHWGDGLNGMAQLLASQKNANFKLMYLQTWKQEHALDEKVRGNLNYRNDLRDMEKFEPHTAVKQVNVYL